MSTRFIQGHRIRIQYLSVLLCNIIFLIHVLARVDNPYESQSLRDFMDSNQELLRWESNDRKKLQWAQQVKEHTHLC